MQFNHERIQNMLNPVYAITSQQSETFGNYFRELSANYSSGNTVANISVIRPEDTSAYLERSTWEAGEIA